MNAPLSVHSILLESLPARQRDVIDRLRRAFAEGAAEIALVGGVVRDVMLQRVTPVKELDFATSATPEQTRVFGIAAGASSIYDVGERFGTIGLVFAGDSDEDAPITAEITTYRTETYPDESRHPEVQLGGRLLDDLARRDFTVNAMAIDLHSGAMIDPFDGEADLAQGLLRAVGAPDARFREDPLRLLRAARFVSQLGFMVEHETASAMRDRASDLRRISNERTYAELTKLLLGPFAAHGLDRLLDSGILPIAMPELDRLAGEAISARGPHREKDLWDHTVRVVEQAPARPQVRWAALLHDAAKPQTRSVDVQGEVHFFGHEREGADLARRLLTRLKADKMTVGNVARLVELHLRPATYGEDWTDSAVRRLMLEAGEVLDDLLDLAAADVTSAREHKQRQAAARIAALREHIARVEGERSLADYTSPLDGGQLMAIFDRPPGRWIATIKDHLRELVIDGALDPDDVVAAEVIARDMIDRDEA